MLPKYDGVAEVWFESETDLMEAMSSPEGQKLGAALLEDEGNFIDHTQSSASIVKEHELKQLRRQFTRVNMSTSCHEIERLVGTLAEE